MLKAIETRYKGYRFRSRLEARWAVFFDALGMPWEYEKEGFDLGSAGRYLPDFWLPTIYDRDHNQGVWIEIKGQKTTKEEDAKCAALCEGTGYSVNLFIGMPGAYEGDSGYQWNAWGETDSSFGGCRWDNYMRFHFCYICRVIKIEFDNEYFDCPKCNQPTCIQPASYLTVAFEAARSARFEHGETP